MGVAAYHHPAELLIYYERNADLLREKKHFKMTYILTEA
jgi:hypothetical protein